MVIFSSLILDGLCARIAHHAARNRAMAPLLCLVHARLRRMVQRLERLLIRVRTGKLRPPRQVRVAPSPHAGQKRPPRERENLIPRGHAWLFPLCQEAAQYAGQVEHLLKSPEIAELLAAAPQANRIFRPLCRMLGLTPPGPPPPPRVRKPRPRAPFPKPPKVSLREYLAPYSPHFRLPIRKRRFSPA
jgi:hypothetical protein